MINYQYSFDCSSEAEKEILIALLSETGFDAFEETDSHLKAFTRLDISNQDLNNIIQLTGVVYTRSIIPDENWNKNWESNFEPVTVFYPGTESVFASVRAEFHSPIVNALHEIIITPKMSFGTGHHATTYGMIELMSSLEFKGKEVVDFGTGTGVLAILAEKLGANSILAIDNDDWSIQNAKENFSVNGCMRIELIRADAMLNILKADIILANINLNVILSNLEMILQSCKKDAQILLSGMLAQDEAIISAALKKHSLKIESINNINNWIILLVKTGH